MIAATSSYYDAMHGACMHDTTTTSTTSTDALMIHILWVIFKVVASNSNSNSNSTKNTININTTNTIYVCK